MSQKRSLPWNNPAPAKPKRPKARRFSQSSSRYSSQPSSRYSSQPSSSSWSSNSRSEPIIIDDTDDDELYEEIFSQQLLLDIDDYESIGHMGTILLHMRL